MPMPNRNVEGNYRYAYQGQEKDPETRMEAFELRLWDARIGRWLTTDPYGQFHSPYLGMGNNPISQVDPDGGMTKGCDCKGPEINLGFEISKLLNNDILWKPLTKEILRNYLKKKYPDKSWEALNSQIGHDFENAWNSFAERNPTLLYSYRPEPSETERLPDGYSDVPSVGPAGTQGFLPGYNYVEVKTKNVTLTNQIRTFIGELSVKSRVVPGYLKKFDNPASITFVTLGNNYISRQVFQDAKKRHVDVVHINAYYKIKDGKLRISFSPRASSTYIHFFSNDVGID